MMHSKVEGHKYHTIADMEADFNLMISNCLAYNNKDTIFNRAAVRLRDLGGAILRQAQRQAQNAGLDPDTGMHLQESPQKTDYYRCTWEDGECPLQRWGNESALSKESHFSSVASVKGVNSQ